MRNFRKVISILLILCMVVGVTGCKKKNKDQNQENDSTMQQSQSTQGTNQSGNSNTTKPTDTPVNGNDSVQTQGGSTTVTVGSGSKAGNFELTGVKSVPADGIGKPGVDFVDIPAGPVQGWEDFDVIPGFNPLGSYDLYGEVYTDTARYDSIKYLADDGYTPAYMTVGGEYTYLQIYAEEPSKNWILYKAEELNATIYKTDEKSAFFSFVDKNNIVWFVYALTEYDGYRISEYSAPLLKRGGELKIAGDGVNFSDGRFIFCTKNEPGKQFGAAVNFDGTCNDVYDYLRITVSSDFGIGSYDYDYCEYVRGYLYDGISPMDGQTIIVDNIPAEPEWVFWTVINESFNNDYEAYIIVNEIGDIDSITLGEQPGMVKIISSGLECHGVLKPYADINTADVDAYSLDGGFRDNEGNYCFVAPAGYYRFELLIEGESEYNCYIQNIPVSAGKITEVVVPSEVKAYASDVIQMNASFESDAGNMEITSATENGDSVTLGIIVHDPDERDLFPENKDFTITENGTPATVTKIEREPAGANVIMCIDSSGSIRKSLPSIIESACRFVENLPENSTISIIEFKQELIEHKGNTKEEAVKALKSITAKGDTSLYDAISRALDRLEDVPRAYVIAFTDGVDSREPGDPAPGSAISKEDLCEKIKGSKATVLGMGFGAGHDASTLKMISESSEGGQYYYVADVSALDGAFAAVQSKFGNQFKVTYKRPVITVDEASDVPIVSIMMDTSRSMNLLPGELEGDIDIRIERVRSLFHDFIMGLPDNTLGQFATFTTYLEGCDIVKTGQLLTDKKNDLLKALSLERTEGGTPIQKALESAYNSLKNQNSSKKVMVFFTDAALQVEDDGSGAQQQAFDDVLEDIREAGIRVLFAGLGGGEYAPLYDGIFKYAADKAGGDYIISSSVDDIRSKLNELLSKVDEPMPTQKGVNIFADLTCKAEDGSSMSYSAGFKADALTMKTQKGSVKAPSVIKVSDGGAYITYSGDTSALLYGSDTSDETQITARIAFADNMASNQFADLSVSEAYLMPMFKGIDAGSKRFLALNVSLTFHKKDKSAKEVGYQIPNIFNHFYVSLNNGRMVPASKATWLAETPLAVPGESSIQVNELKDATGNKLEKGETLSGILIFVVDEAYDWKQLSLHCYDISYGHLEIPLVGAMPQTLMNISKLPTEEPADISDSFKLSLTGCEDTRDIAGAEFQDGYNNDSLDQSMRVLEMQFESKVQALLDIDPSQRFYYKISTNSGDLLTKMSKAVNNLPMGFTGKTKFAPGSVTSVRLPFDVPSGLKDAKATLWGDLRTGSFEMNVNSGSVYKGYEAGQKFEHEYFTLVVNKLAYKSEYSDQVILDFTVIDKKDGEGTGGFDTALYLYRDVDGLDFETNTSDSPNGATIINAVSAKGLGNFGDMNDLFAPVGILFFDEYYTNRLIFGATDADSTWGAYDGQSRRGILIFNVPNDDFRKEWRLSCELLPDLSMPIDSRNFYGDSPLLVEKVHVETNDSLDEAIDQKVEAAVALYRATHPDANTDEKIGLSDDELIGTHIETPFLTVYGTQAMEAVKNINDFHNLMQSITWMPEHSESSVFAPETVITQGYGFDADFAILADRLLKKLGYKTSFRFFELTDAGKENLARFGGFAVEDTDFYKIYAVQYTDEKGASRLYVPAFRHYAEDLSGLGSLEYGTPSAPCNTEGHIVITAYGEYTGDPAFADQIGMFDQFSSIFGGGDGEAEGYYDGVTLLDKEFDFAEVGRNPMDISFISLGKDDDGIHEKVTAVADTATGLLKDGETWVSTGEYKFDKIEVVISGRHFSEEVVHTYMLDEDDSLLDVFMSIGVNLPTMTDAAVKAYETALSASIKANEGIDPTNYGTARWTTHSAVAKMAKAITDYDADICEKLGVVSAANTSRRPVSVCATLKSDGKDAIGSFDLMSLDRWVLRTPETFEKDEYYREDIQRSYYLAMSSLASQGEGDVFEGGETYLDVWASMPENAGIMTIDCYDYDHRQNAIELYTTTLNAPKYLVERLENAPECVAFQMPTAPGKLHGEDHWAWLEINTETMETISVFDTGERGMAAYILGLTPKGAAEFTVGAFIGVACSAFSVSAYALESDNEEYIMKSAKALMGKTLDYLKKFRGVVSDLQNLQAIKDDPIEFLNDKGKGYINDKANFNIMTYYEYLWRQNPEKLKQEPTFTDGFEIAMKMYFGEWIDPGY